MKDAPNIICIGESQDPNSFVAGRQAARMAMEKMKPNSSAAWTLAFCGGKHDPQAFLKGLRSRIGDVEIVGGSSVGTITNHSIGYVGYECAVAVFTSDVPKPITIAFGGLNEDEEKRTKELHNSLGSSTPVWGFYIDCAGRSSAFNGADIEEASILQDTLPKNIPLLGFDSGVELAPLIGRTRPLDWTGVLTFFTLERL